MDFAPFVVLECSYEHLKPTLITCYHMIPSCALEVGVELCKDYGKSGIFEFDVGL